MPIRAPDRPREFPGPMEEVTEHTTFSRVRSRQPRQNERPRHPGIARFLLARPRHLNHALIQCAAPIERGLSPLIRCGNFLPWLNRQRPPAARPAELSGVSVANSASRALPSASCGAVVSATMHGPPKSAAGLPIDGVPNAGIAGRSSRASRDHVGDTLSPWRNPRMI